jgi:hypothetical protein
MIKFSDLLREIGDTSGHYRYRNVQDVFKITSKEEAHILYIYEFETENFNYTVELSKSKWNNRVGVMFEISWDQAADLGGNPFNAVTNEGNVLKVVGTVVSIVKDFHNEMAKEGRFPRFYKGYKFSGMKKEGVDTNQRNKLYIKFIKSQFPNAEVHVRRSEVTVIPEQR